MLNRTERVFKIGFFGLVVYGLFFCVVTYFDILGANQRLFFLVQSEAFSQSFLFLTKLLR